MASVPVYQDLARRPKYAQWSFNDPRPTLVKLNIDLRKPSRSPKYEPPSTQFDLPLPRPQLLQPGATSLWNPNLKENQAPRPSSSDSKLFGADRFEEVAQGFYGGPLILTEQSKWRPTFCTRASGDVVGAETYDIPFPANMSRIIRSTASMGEDTQQSGLWVAPRYVIATLHFQNWRKLIPTQAELEAIRDDVETFSIESEISSSILNPSSPKVTLVAFNIANDIGLFKLQDEFPPSRNWAEIDWLMERDELHTLRLHENAASRRRIGCVGFNGKVVGTDVEAIKQEAYRQLVVNFGNDWLKFAPIDLDFVTKPGMRSFAPGTLDSIVAKEGGIHLGVSSSLWKGSSGGPGVVLQGPHEGRIIGLIRGYDSFADPYNLLNGFPNGLKEELKKFIDQSA